MATENSSAKNSKYSTKNILKTIIFSAFGLFMFFVNVPINGTSTTMISHAVNFMVDNFSTGTYVICMICLAIGAIRPFKLGTWKRNGFSCFFAIAGLLSIPFAIMDIFNLTPQFLVDTGLMDLMFRNLIPQLLWVIIFSAVIITFILDYGLMEFVAVYAQPFMRKLFRLPGLTAVNAVSCFMGNYSVGAIIANKLYQENKLTRRETALLLTGFGTVAVSYMMIQMRMAGLADYFNTVFFSALAVTMLTSLIQCRLWPITSMPDVYCNGSTTPIEEEILHNKTKHAVEAALTVSANAAPIHVSLTKSFLGAIRMLFTIIPMMSSIALVILYFLEYTPYLNFINYIFLPIVTLLQLPDATVVSKALSIALFDTTVSCTVVASLPIVARFAVTIASISEIVYFCGSLPVFLSVDTGFSAFKYMIVAIERLIISLVLATLIGYVIF